MRTLVTFLALVAAVATGAWAAALPPSAAAVQASVASLVPAGPFPKSVWDTAGHRSTLRAPPKRIVSIALSADEILVDLVPPERLVGLTRFVHDTSMSPVSARAPRAAARVSGEPEAILALQPDIVFASAYTRAEALSILTGAGIPVVGTGSLVTLDDLLHAVTILGDAVGEPERARNIVSEARARIDVVASGAAERHARVLIWDGGFTYGKGTLEDDILRIAGAANVAADAGLVGPAALTEEAAIAFDPDLILVPVQTGAVEPHAPELLGGDPIWNAVGAARRRAVFGVPRAWIGSVSHYAVRALEAIGQIVDGSRA